MQFQRQVLFWFGALVVLSLLLWLLSDILLPFVAGMALAYLLNPLTNRLQRLGIGRTVAALSMIGVVVLALVVLGVLIVPILADQLANLISNIPGYARRMQQLLVDPNRPWLTRLFGGGDSSQTIGDLVTQGTGWLATFMASLWSGGRALISLFTLLVVTPVVAFYLLVDWPRLVAWVHRYIPLKHRATVERIMHEMDAAISGYVRGQASVCVLLGSYYAIVLSLLGLNFGLLIGLLSGLVTFIPYIGSMTGLVLSVGIAVAQFWPDWTWILAVLGAFLFGQFLEGNILTPKLVGENIGVHPVWLMFAMFAFGYLFGFVGLLLAAPLAAAVGVLARFALRRYRDSALFTGEMVE